jgi:DNA-binding transcriptional LysR family regulator
MYREPGMEMHQVRYFLAVARRLNFTRAAEELRVAQPSLTRAIQKLEAELGGLLFRRERSKTHLTDLGRVMLPHLQASFTAAETAKNHARRLKKHDMGSLALGICMGLESNALTTLLLGLIRELASLDVSVEVAEAEIIERRLLAGEFDAAVLAPVEPTHERFNLCLIHADELVVAFAANHRFSKYQSLELEALDGEPLIVRFGCRIEEALAGLMDVRGLTRNIRHRSNDSSWLAELVRSGSGCGIFPRSVAEAHTLAFRKLDGVLIEHRTMLATVAGRRHSLAVATLLRQVGNSSASNIEVVAEGAPEMDKSQGARDSLGALAESARQRAPHFPSVDQAEPARSATAPTATPAPRR